MPSLPASTATAVAATSSLAGTFNNHGITSDSSRSRGNFDGLGYSYSTEGLQTSGLTLGQTFGFNGFHFPLTNVVAGAFDDTAAQAQRVQLSHATGSSLAFLGAANNGPASGAEVITYTDGTVQLYTLTFSDWTLNIGQAQPSLGNTIAATAPYRNQRGGFSEGTRTYVFYDAVPLLPGKTLASVTLPRVSRLHVMSMAVGTPATAGQ